MLAVLRLVIVGVWRRLMHDRIGRVSTSLAYTTLLSLVPLATVVVSTLSLFPFFEEWRVQIESLLYSHFLPTSSEILKSNMTGFIAQARQLPTLGLVGLILSVLLMLYTIEVSFNDIYGVKKGRAPMQRIIVYWATVTLGPILLVLGLAVTSYLVSIPLLAQEGSVLIRVDDQLEFVPVTLQGIGLLFLFLVVPNTKVSIFHALIGVVVAIMFFAITKHIFFSIVEGFGTYQTIYGALWIIPVFLLWIVVSWYVVLIGACVTAEFERVRRNEVSLKI